MPGVGTETRAAGSVPPPLSGVSACEVASPLLVLMLGGLGRGQYSPRGGGGCLHAGCCDKPYWGGRALSSQRGLQGAG